MGARVRAGQLGAQRLKKNLKSAQMTNKQKTYPVCLQSDQ